ncbi:hypothetical protein [Aliiroseovarius sp. M344]|nr:hypothetical protein [Aliiroseovarius sp. M344]
MVEITLQSLQLMLTAFVISPTTALPLGAFLTLRRSGTVLS